MTEAAQMIPQIRDYDFQPAKIGAATAVPVLMASLLINLLTIATPMAALLIYDRVLPNGTTPTLGILLAGVVVIVLVDALLRIARVSILTRAGARVDHINRDRVIGAFLTRRFPEPNGVALGTLTSTLAAVNTLREQQLLRLQALIDVPFGLAFILLIAAIGGWLALIPASACALLVVLAYCVSRLNERMARAHVAAEDKKQRFTGRVFSNFRAVKAIAAELPLVNKFVHLQQIRSSIVRDQMFASLLSRDLFVTFSQIIIAAVVIAGTLAVLDGRFTLGGLAACTLLAGRALEPIQTGYQILVHGRTSNVIRKQIEELSAPGEIHEHLGGEDCVEAWVRPPSVEIKDLTVVAPKSGKSLLQNISASIEGGSIVTISGDRGSGKTTLARTLIGLVPETGSVLFGSTRLDWHTAGALRRRITYFPRVPDLPSGSIIDVLSDGDDGDFADIRYLSHLIGLDEATKRLPEGYETRVGPDSLELPTGVRQQIAIVRGIAKQHKVMIFDDTTFSLDATTEMRLAQILKLMRGAATVIFFTDRPVIQALADQRFEIAENRLNIMAMDGA